MTFSCENNRIFYVNESGKLLAEITFPSRGDCVVEINRTFVDDSLRGQGIADQLMCAALDKIREQNAKAVASCSYAKKWFEKHPDQTDVLLPN